MEQSSAINLSVANAGVAADPDARAEDAAEACAYRLRPAGLDDIVAMEEIEHEAFPTLFPPTRFGREVQRSNAAYFVATRDWTPEELAEDPYQRPQVTGLTDFSGAAAWTRDLASRFVYERISGRERERPAEYVAGLVGLWFVLDEAHVVIIGSRAKDRRQGIGELMLIGALETAMRRDSRVVTLEVRASNEAARTLYSKYGFREVGVRKRYYADNDEDAVIMTTPPIQSDDYWIHFHALTRDHAERWGDTVRIIS